MIDIKIIDGMIYIEIDKQDYIYIYKDRQTDGMIDRQKGRQIDEMIDRQDNRYKNRQME